ncbi:MAG: hypothetical protein ACRET6_04905 [Burkholderiales bacterium]
MFRSTPYALRAALLFISLLFGAASALAQKTTHPLLPSVNLGLAAPKVGVGLDVAVPPVVVPRTVVGVPAALPVPMVTTTVAPPIASTPSVSATVGGQGGGVGAALSVNVPPVSGLTPPLGANVNVNTGGSTPALAVGVDVSVPTLGVSVRDGGIPGAPPAPNLPAPGPTPATQDQLLQQRLALLPTCR